MAIRCLLLAALLLGDTPGAQPLRSDPEPPADSTDGLRRALKRAADGGSAPGLDLSVECREDGQLQSLRVYGDGVAIWNGERQFRLGKEKVAALLRAMQAADFAGFEQVYGGSKPPVPTPRPDGSSTVTQLTCRIDLALDGTHKEVVQLSRGEQSPAVKELAQELLAIGEPPVGRGVGATSLGEGLRLLERGQLALQAWSAVLHRKPDASSGASASGFLLAISGGHVTTRPYTVAGGYQREIGLELRPEEARSLARQLAATDPAAWPANLYAGSYTDLSLRVLNKEKAVQARPFAGLAPTTHGALQRRFEQAVAILERLHRRVLQQGRPVPANPPD